MNFETEELAKEDERKLGKSKGNLGAGECVHIGGRGGSIE